VIKDRRTSWIEIVQASASFAFRANNAEIMEVVGIVATHQAAEPLRTD
jgi:hypothetical protein